jgi:hypothetical protein
VWRRGFSWERGTFCEATAFIVYSEVPAAAIDLQRSASAKRLGNVGLPPDRFAAKNKIKSNLLGSYRSHLVLASRRGYTRHHREGMLVGRFFSRGGGNKQTNKQRTKRGGEKGEGEYVAGGGERLSEGDAEGVLGHHIGAQDKHDGRGRGSSASSRGGRVHHHLPPHSSARERKSPRVACRW